MREAELRALLARGALSGAQPRSERRRPARAGRRLREGARRAAEDGRSTSAWRTVRAYMRHVQDNAEESVRRAIAVLHDGEFTYRARQRRADPRADRGRSRGAQRDRRLQRHRARELASNYNAPPAVVHAAVLYVFRTLVRRRDPDERRLPDADHGGHPGALAARTRTFRPRPLPATSRPRSA